MVAGRKVMWRGPVFNEPDNDESHMYRHYGWNYISTVGGFYVFENDGAKAGELDTEPETMAGALKKKLGLEVTSEKVEDRGRVYKLPAA